MATKGSIKGAWKSISTDKAHNHWVEPGSMISLCENAVLDFNQDWKDQVKDLHLCGNCKVHGAPDDKCGCNICGMKFHDVHMKTSQ